MCGILGAFSPKPQSSLGFAESFVEALDLVQYRGPDGAGYWRSGARDVLLFTGDSSTSVDRVRTYFDESTCQNSTGPDVVLGHRRLSIIDLSIEAFQPMCLHEQDVWAAYNGEIYNYIELRAELEAQGVRFHTKSDTEVILRAYETWGSDCFARLNGMWSIAMWDGRRKRLILSRDRIGVKPLYYAVIDETLYFASEIKQLLQLQRARGHEKKWNAFRLYEFLSRGLLHHAEDTLYEGIYAFKPGHFAELTPNEINVEAVRAAQSRFWDFPEENAFLREPELSFTEAAAQLREILSSAVSLRLRSDVPVGSALSGGLDSSAIVSLIASMNHDRQKTFSATFSGHPIDERRFAEAVVKGKNLEAVFVSPSPQGLEQELSRLAFHQDGPFGSTSIFAQWEVFKAARQNGVTVMLDGQGADELFGGYEGFFRAHLRSTIGRGGVLLGTVEGLRFVYNHPRYFNLGRVKKRFVHRLDWLAHFTPSARDEIDGRKDAIRKNGDRLCLGQQGRRYSDPLREALYRATVCTSLPALLAYEDRNSMAFSVESRTPFLDYRLVDFAFSCPSGFHMRDGARKALLREALRGLVPEEIRLRKDKIGFATPEESWRKGYFTEWNRRAWNSGPLQHVFDRAKLEDISAMGSWQGLILAMSDGAF